jgi:sulfur relay (sulfurtransferase) complex TusBCD TusD component (DsrE family)
VSDAGRDVRRFAVVLASGASSERTGTAVRLAERLLARGHRVAVFAHENAVALTAGDDEVARAVAALLRRGVHGGTLDWVVDEQAARRLGVADGQAAGVVPGDHADMWAFVREADVVLSAGAC